MSSERHHYIPQFYLRKWSRQRGSGSSKNRVFQTMQWRRGTSSGQLTNTKNIAQEKGFHDVRDETFSVLRSLEDQFTKIESTTSSALDILEGSVLRDRSGIVTIDVESVNELLSSMIALFWLRTRFAADFAQNTTGPPLIFGAELQYRSWLAVELLQYWTHLSAERQATLVRCCFSEELDDRFLRRDMPGNTVELLMSGVQVAKEVLLSRFRFRILTIEIGAFITSDVPVVLLDAFGKNMLGVGINACATVLFPIGPNRLVIADQLGRDFLKAVGHLKLVEHMNRLQVHNCYHSIFYLPDIEPIGVERKHLASSRKTHKAGRIADFSVGDNATRNRLNDLRRVTPQVLEMLGLPPFGFKPVQIVGKRTDATSST